MPVYEYRCYRCEYEFEREQRITAPPIKTCPECSSRRVKRLISQTSFVLKGGGWYSDLYSSKSKKKTADADSDSKAKSEASNSTDSSSKSGDTKDAKKKSSKSSKNAA